MSKIAGVLAVLGGAMLIVGGFIGTTSSVIDGVKEAVEKWMPGSDQKDDAVLALTVMMYIALLGGAAVVIGGYLMWHGFDLAGKVWALLGTAVGAVTLIVAAVVAYVAGNWDAFVTANMTFIGIGLALSVIGRRLA